jgi:DNA polymerase-3 subunit alpha
MQAGLDQQYIEIKNQGFYNEDNMPEQVQDILKETQYTLIYQEQIMALLNKMAGFSLKEADDARRAMGKKKKEVLESYKEKFISGSLKNGIEETYSLKLWEDIMGFADYCLDGNTLIWTKEFGYKKISEIVNERLDCTIKSMYNSNKSKVVEQKISQHWDKGFKDCYKYYLDNGTHIICTSDHKFLTIAGEMKSIDNIFNLNEKLLWRQ